MKFKIGCHVSISGSINLSFERAARLGCNTFQIFTKNPRGWAARTFADSEIQKFRENIKLAEISPIFAHISYLPNLASQNEVIYKKSLASFMLELERCSVLNIPYFVIHGGSYKGGTLEQGLSTYVKSLLRGLEGIEKKVIILIENSAGGKNSITGDLNNISKILDEIGDKQAVKICFDTCHAFGSGYDLRDEKGINKTIKNIESSIGMDRIVLVHANDSKGDLGSHRDFHEHIGLGKIGRNGFRAMVNHPLFNQKPWILETPVNEIRGDRENIEYILNMLRK